ncbi:MAG: SUMF1/EgtB/PvdO family nonheme iron enzyme [Anaerolineae bacterium]|nr:SUMF1/EgtB/PvdO family nonheme iron enzyme [Anaerolineae bacterium]
MYPTGAAACGALDMAGNVWQWCLNNYNRAGQKAVRGGAFDNDALGARCTFREHDDPHYVDPYFGFRVVCAAAPN